MGAALRGEGPRAARFLTIANALTALRLASVPFFAAAVAYGAVATACALYALAVATDFFDGRVARLRGEATPFGGLLDHASDALFVTAGLGALAWLGAVPAPLPFLVAAAFVQYVVDSRAHAGRRLRASKLGRYNGIAYFALVAAPLVRDLCGIAWPTHEVVRALGWALAATTLASMADRFLAARSA
jgi:CDP-diacylglycerol--glycerol-3-phosphate 3-phosphatidyltransferase